MTPKHGQAHLWGKLSNDQISEMYWHIGKTKDDKMGLL